MNSEQQRAAIERLRELEKKATPGEWWIDESGEICSAVPLENKLDKRNIVNQSFICALRNEALPLLREMTQALSEAKAENVGLKGQFLDHAETDSYLRMVKYAAHVKDLYRWEKEQKEAVQAENDRLKADAERTDKAFSKALKDLVLAKRESKRFGNQVVLAVNKGCELQAENQRLREGIGRAVELMESKENLIEDDHPFSEWFYCVLGLLKDAN